ncbi:unnamed protein product, partial [Brassica rapa subsp. trilocularis]
HSPFFLGQQQRSPSLSLSPETHSYVHLRLKVHKTKFLMAKGGKKLMKLKSVLKKLNSFNTKPNQPPDPANHGRSSALSAFSSEERHTVYVGSTRRLYHVSSDVVSHPLFQQLAAVDGGCGGENGSIAVSCEVVLFEHMLWMLENANADESGLESVHELVEFYSC